MMRLFTSFCNICSMKSVLLFVCLIPCIKFLTQAPSTTWKNTEWQPKNGQLFEATLQKGYLEGRKIRIWLPDDYFKAHQSYDVVYFHDGQMLFDSTATWNQQSWDLSHAAQKYLSRKRCAIVGIDNSPEKRYAEFFPAPIYAELPSLVQFSLRDSLWNGLPLFLAYADALIADLFPLVESSWRVKKGGEHRTMVGSSMGAIASLTFLLMYPEEMARVACLSIHLPLIDVGYYQQRFKEPLSLAFNHYMVQKSGQINNKSLFIDRGDQSLDAAYAAYFPDFIQSIDGLKEKNRIELRLIHDSGHSERDWSKRIGPILKKLLK